MPTCECSREVWLDNDGEWHGRGFSDRSIRCSHRCFRWAFPERTRYEEDEHVLHWGERMVVRFVIWCAGGDPHTKWPWQT